MQMNLGTIARLTLAVLALLIAVQFRAVGAPPAGQATYATPEDAVKALREATASKEPGSMEKLFGAAGKELVNPDPVQRVNECADFSKHLTEMVNIVKAGDDRATLYIGKENWPFPIPLMKKDNAWYFDTVAGKEEILARRVGENELNAIDVCRAYVSAQREYHRTDWNHDDILEYAQHMTSTQGKKDGLFWEPASGESPSPFGRLVASAQAEGYPIHEHEDTKAEGAKTAVRPYHGYFFHILKKQGSHAPGGEYDYIANGHMVAGFALIAYPEEWGNSGVMTFIVNQVGKVYQKNLGAKTLEAAKAIKAYDPDETWELVKD